MSNVVVAERTNTTLPRAESQGATQGAVTVMLRVEAGIALLVSVMAYRALGGGWWPFAILFLAPDLTMLGYLVNRRVGAIAYNAGHTYLSPTLLAAAGYAAHAPVLFAGALIWTAHIGFDRLVGYGLKYPSAFGATHLGWAGRRA